MLGLGFLSLHRSVLALSRIASFPAIELCNRAILARAILARLRIALRVSGTRARGNARSFYMFCWVGGSEALAT